MTLRPDDVEAAQLDDLVVVCLPLQAPLVDLRAQRVLVLVRALLAPLADELLSDLVFVVAAEDDVDAAARHVRRDRDRVLAAGLRDDLRLALVLLRVQDVVLDAAAREQLRQVLGRLDGDRADEHRLAVLVALGDVVEHRGELRFLRPVDEVVVVASRDGLVRRDLDDVEAVDLCELLLLRLRGTGHPGELARRAGSSSGA